MAKPATMEQQDWDQIPPIMRKQYEEMSKFEDKLKAPAAAPAEPAPVVDEPAAPDSTTAKDTPPEPKDGTPAEDAPAEPETFEDIATEEMTKEVRYKRLEGMQRAIGRDLSKAQRENKALQAEVEALKAQVAARPAAPITTPPAAAAPAGTVPENIDSLREAFGERNLLDLVNFLRSQGFAITQDVHQVAEKVGTMETQVGSFSKQLGESALERFESAMSDLTNGRWQTINHDPRFKKWLEEPEGRTGQSRETYALRFIQEHNATMLAPYFNDFADEVGDIEDTPVTETKPKLDRKAHAAPKATRAATVIKDTEKPKVKMSEFAKLDADVRAGKYTSDDPAKHEELQKKLVAEQARLNEAQRLGLVVPG